MDSLDLYLSRRKETQNWLLLALGVGLGFAFAARVPLLVISLPLTWISGGMSVAFLWVAGPPVMWFLHVMAFNALYESERARKATQTAARKQRDAVSGSSRTDSLGIVDDGAMESEPLLPKGAPFPLKALHGTLWIAPVLVNCLLFGSYLQFVRPGGVNGWAFSSRLGQEADALLGLRGWGWFMPLAPSLDGNIAELIKKTDSKDTRDKYESLRKQIPEVFFPLQTWLYIAGIFFGLDLAIRALQIQSGADSPRGLIQWLDLARDRLINGIRRRRES